MAESSHSPSPDASEDVQPQTEQQVAGSGEAQNDDQAGDWCKVFCHKNEAGQEYYFTNIKTGESSWEEPTADYWLWDYKTGTYHSSGLQKPTPKATLAKEQATRDEEKNPMNYDEKDPVNGWQGYNPRVHGTWDKDAPYMAYHHWLEYVKELEQNPQGATAQQGFQTYEATGQFNAQTGRFQTADQTADRYDSSNRAGRQMNHFFDVDSAANAHDGRSLKEERRNNKPSKKEVAEMNQRRKDKKHQKRMAFLKS